ncbi:carotenoid biosynthesis protein [Paenibacillus sp. YYML68]|uniref:carotenoid biosynthesis protein n=1 Tax=Paenibacillus sp. YYML68 TaxID=2909250 RepID=UPI00249187BB|nr:carotenoid biosynthesis protein [Paenibacillus sp. YYML68]
MVNQWLFRLSVLYAIWFACGYVLVSGGLLPKWLAWANGFYLIIGGATALVWYTRKYGARQALLLFVICASVSYAAEWIGVHTGHWFGPYEYGASFAPLVFGVPLAIPFAWCMLLIIAKAFAPVPQSKEARRGLRLSEKMSPELSTMKRQRARQKRRSFWLPALWTASMVTAIDLLLDPVAAQQRYWSWSGDQLAPWNVTFYDIPLSNFICWWLTALLIINIVNYLHDEYVDHREQPSQSGPFVPLMLLLTLESLFLTLAAQSGLWWAVAINIGLLGILFIWRRWDKEAFA